MDNAPGHLDMEDIGLQNITFIRLPPNTTSVAQPLDAGPDSEYKKDREIEALKDDLKKTYPERAESIDKQTDYGILTFLESCIGRGPTCQFTDAITSVASDSRFNKFFKPNWKSLITPWDDAVSTELESTDEDYNPTLDARPVPLIPERPLKRTLQLRSGPYDINNPLLVPSSQDSSISSSQASTMDDNMVSQIFEEIKDSMIECTYLMSRRKKQAVSGVGYDLSGKALNLALHLRDYLEAMKDVLVLENDVKEQSVVIDDVEADETIVVGESGEEWEEEEEEEEEGDKLVRRRHN
ncbi:hypothetical protein FBU30_006393 [Linnemannia zychae]|nr:hypothetical protein FBU30_006393 [Linnemannia zychae]